MRRWGTARPGAVAAHRAIEPLLVACVAAGALSLAGVVASGPGRLPARPQRREPILAQPGGSVEPTGLGAAGGSPRFSLGVARLLAGRPPETSPVGLVHTSVHLTGGRTSRRFARPRRLRVATSRAARGAALTLRQWCVRYLAYLGAPARRADDPRVAFLERWATVEATFGLGNLHNPLDSEMPEPGAALWNTVGVRRYPSLLEGFRATRATMELGINRPILLALRRPGATMAELALALAKSDWTGRGQTSWLEQGYASEISHQSPFSFGLPEPTVSLRGTVVGPFGHPRGGVCVAAVPRGAPVHRVETAADGRFELTGLPRTRYRLELSACSHGRSTASAWFIDARAKEDLRTRNGRRATTFGAACSVRAHCPDEDIRLRRPIEFGRTTPPLSWPPPAAIDFGTGLSRAELDATAGVKGTFRYRPPLGTRLSGGLHELHAVFDPADGGAFKTVSIDRPLSVHAASPRLAWAAPAPIPSTEAVTARELDATAAVPGTMGYSVPHGIRLPPGRHVLRVTFVPADPRDYAVARATVTLTVLARSTPRSLPGSPVRARAGGANRRPRPMSRRPAEDQAWVEGRR